MNDPTYDNDNFLTSFRRAPRREFAMALAEHLAGTEEPPMYEKLTASPRRRLSLGLAGLLVALIVAVAVIPAARAVAQELARSVAGLGFVDSDTRPDPGPGGVVTLESTELTLAEAQAFMAFKMPAQLPEGFVPYDGRYDPTITLTTFPMEGGDNHLISLRWENNNRTIPAVISLNVNDRADVNWLVGDVNAVEEVQIGSLSAALWYGNWNVDSGRFEGSDINLSWSDGGLRYTLIGVREQGTTLDDLLLMAGSME